MTVGERLKQARKEKRLTQKEVCGKIGVSQVMIHYIETNKKKPSAAVLNRLALFYGIPIDSLVGINAEQ